MTSANRNGLGPGTRRVAVAAAVLSFAAGSACLGAQTPRGAGKPTRGYRCLFMGHSFFAPIARKFAAHPRRCGFPEHKQTVVFHGGTSGSPGNLWNSPQQDVVDAKRLLATGAVDVLGLTYYPNEGSAYSDYDRWVRLALEHNPETRFVIQSPWCTYEGRSLAKYEADSELMHADIHGLIDRLRAAHPGTVFLCIPQGRWMVGLWRLYEQRQLPEVTELKRSGTQGNGSHLFADDLGHGGPIPVDSGALLWLATIYRVDLDRYRWKTNTRFDLKKLARKIVHDDPYCGLGRKPKRSK